MKKIKVIAVISVFIIILSATVVFSYFTTYVKAEGSVNISFDGSIDMVELDRANGNRKVKFSSAIKRDVYIRAKAFVGSVYEIEYSGNKWEQREDGYCYYTEPVQVGGTTEELEIKVPNSDDEKLNIAVVYEVSPVQYDEEGYPYDPYGGWSKIII